MSAQLFHEAFNVCGTTLKVSVVSTKLERGLLQRLKLGTNFFAGDTGDVAFEG